MISAVRSIRAPASRCAPASTAAGRPGFEVDAVLTADEGPRYRIRRRSDDSVLPSDFGPDEVRSEKKGRSMWWI